MEAEVIALARRCRELLPIMDIVAVLGEALGLQKKLTTMYESINEDNAEVLIVAEALTPQYTP